MMKTGPYSLDLNFDQVLNLVKQLPKEDKVRLSKELERQLIDSKLTSLLKAFKTDELIRLQLTRKLKLLGKKYMPDQNPSKVIVDTNLWISFLIGKELQNLQDLIVNEKVKLITSDQLLLSGLIYSLVLITNT